MTEDKFILRIKRILNVERKRHGTPMALIARKTGISYPTIYGIFKREDIVNISILSLKMICDAMGISMIKLLSDPELLEPIGTHTINENLSKARKAWWEQKYDAKG